jgi:hypothetical protein
MPETHVRRGHCQVSGVPPRARCQVDPTPLRNPLSDRPGHAPLDCLRDRRVSSERSPRHSKARHGTPRHAGVQRQSRKSQRGPQAASRWLHLTTGGANDLSFSFPHVPLPSSPLVVHPSCSSHSSPPAPDLKGRAVFRRFESSARTSR